MKAAEHLIQSALDGNQDSGIMISRLSSDIKSLDDKEMIVKKFIEMRFKK